MLVVKLIELAVKVGSGFWKDVQCKSAAAFFFFLFENLFRLHQDKLNS